MIILTQIYNHDFIGLDYFYRGIFNNVSDIPDRICQTQTRNIKCCIELCSKKIQKLRNKKKFSGKNEAELQELLELEEALQKLPPDVCIFNVEIDRFKNIAGSIFNLLRVPMYCYFSANINSLIQCRK